MTSPPAPSNDRPSNEPTRASTAQRSRAWCFDPPADSVLSLPNRCANCCGPAGASLRLEPRSSAGRRELLVPYCAHCSALVGAYKTNGAVGLALGLLAGLVLLLGLPLSTWPLGPASYASIAALGTALPVWLSWWTFVRRPTVAPQTSRQAAVWWDKAGLVGTNEAWMTELAELNRGETSAVDVPGRLPAAGLVLPVTVGAIAPGLFHVLFPTLVVLNLSSQEFEIHVDGRQRAVVGVTSLESPTAGTRLALGAGGHLLQVRPRGDASETHAVRVHLEAGGQYLFAPGADGYCFWLERTTYGRAPGGSRVTSLGGKEGFYRLPSAIDTWFGANPEPNSDQTSTGGEMVALRHGRCANKPEPSR